MSLLFWIILIQQRPVIKLDDLVVEGEIRRPRLIHIEASRLPEALEKAALFNLIELEKRLLEHRPPGHFPKPQKSAN